MQQKKKLITLALIVLSASVQAEEWRNAPVQETFKNWQTTCNNLNDCEVRNTDPTLRIIVKRQAGSEAKPSIVFRLPRGANAQGMVLDGKTSPSDIKIGPPQGNDDFMVGSSDTLADIQQWVKATGKAQTLALAPGAEAVSLEGLNAALKLMDKRQGRVDNQTALLEPGTREPSAVPARPAAEALDFPIPPVVPLTDPVALIDGAVAANGKLLEQLNCHQDETTREYSGAAPLNNQQALVFIDCGQVDFKALKILFISSRDNPKQAQQLKLPLPLKGADGQPMQLTTFSSTSYEPEEGSLESSQKSGDILDDCGYRGSWKYDGKTFHLRNFKNLPGCDAILTFDMPSVWMTKGAEF